MVKEPSPACRRANEGGLYSLVALKPAIYDALQKIKKRYRLCFSDAIAVLLQNQDLPVLDAWYLEWQKGHWDELDKLSPQPEAQE
jgi:hypothetical protein